MHQACESNPSNSLLEVLADEQRRCVVAYLSDTSDDVASVSELTRHVTKHCADAHNREQVAVNLHHVGLPKLEEAGVLEYDSRSNTVRYHPGSKVETLLDCLREQE